MTKIKDLSVKRDMTRTVKKKAEPEIVKNSRPNKSIMAGVSPPQGFEFPEEILDRINECSGGGFVLLCKDANGEPRVHCSFDDAITAMGLFKFGKDYFKTGCRNLRRGVEFNMENDME